MQIKKYIAPTLKEATALMKEELGSESIILSTRIIENPDDYNSRKVFELTAGVDDDFTFNKFYENKRPAPELKKKSFEDEVKNISERVYSKPQPKAGQDILENLKAVKASSAINLEDIVEKLTDQEVNKNVIDAVLADLNKYKSFLHPSNIDNYVVSSISSMIPTRSFELQKSRLAKVVAVVGPTGVGKTTCIAKLAVIAKILHELKIGLISIDTYRLGAIDQLKIFSEISNIDLRVAYSPEEMPKLVSSLRKNDIIFIDTAGRSQKNLESLQKTKMYLDEIDVDEVLLVLNSTVSSRNMQDVIEKFRIFKYNSLIFSKLDEAVTYGNILNIASNSRVPVSFVTNGQVIPDDILAADSSVLANMIYTGRVSK